MITGIVQGVGFRPFIYALALRFQLTGSVENTSDGVVIEVEGRPDDVAGFGNAISSEAPPLARIQRIDQLPMEVVNSSEFLIIPSQTVGFATTFVAPDVATCADCRRDIGDRENRRYGYPFTNCTNCGPRYSIITDIPYDRPNTTMSAFRMCTDCSREYSDPSNRRFHAQPIACPVCGPSLSVPISAAAAALRRGEIVAIKGLGGFHLATLASDERATRRLRDLKHREDKPFALMVPSIAVAEKLCEISAAERELLRSAERPIVLLSRRPAAPVADSIAPCSRELGLMLAYTPLHHLLLDEIGAAIVCTSANVSDEPIAYRDDDAIRRLTPIADLFVGHDRPIHIRVEDSVARVVGNKPYLVRRSRGYAPAPISVTGSAPREILACGAELKNTIALARGNHVFVSHHIGDLKSIETYSAFLEAIDHLGKLFQIEPKVVATDLHPDYRSTSYGRGRVELVGVEVQHHHAHVAACLADNNHAGPAIGVAFDGAGLGDDGTIWGGEFLVADTVSYSRQGWLENIPMPGGDAATREPWRMAAAYLDRLGDSDSPDLKMATRNPQWDAVLQISRSGVNSPQTSSMGRLFDAVAALLGIRDRVNYEGQAAIELEHLADESERDAYLPAISSGTGTHIVVGADLVAAALHDLRAGIEPSRIAMRFHLGVAEAVAHVCERIRDENDLNTVALTGGVFLNRILLTETSSRLAEREFEVLRHQRVPCNDGGISFGQAVVAAARDRAGLIAASD